MENEAIFINGIFDSVVDEILNVQQHVPEQILYLQPCSGSPHSVKLAETNRPR